ncbi:hypothetical protein BST61_g5077 [Cercospora zeina]
MGGAGQCVTEISTIGTRALHDFFPPLHLYYTHALRDTSSSAPPTPPPSHRSAALLRIARPRHAERRLGTAVASILHHTRTHAFRCAFAIPTRHLHHSSIASAVLHPPRPEQHVRCFCTTTSSLRPRLHAQTPLAWHFRVHRPTTTSA